MLWWVGAGAGKTVAYAIGILQLLDMTLGECQALVLVPTREDAQHSARTIGELSGDSVTVRACIGGTPVSEEVAALRGGVQVVVGTPGRVHHMIHRRALRMQHVRLFVTDEVRQLGLVGRHRRKHGSFRSSQTSSRWTIT